MSFFTTNLSVTFPIQEVNDMGLRSLEALEFALLGMGRTLDVFHIVGTLPLHQE